MVLYLTEEEEILGVIPARGGSKRVPRKNIKILGGRPLIVWSIEAAQKAKSLSYCLVSTDDADIARVSRMHGAWVPFTRPAEISVDCDTSIVLHHALEWYEREKRKVVDYVVCLQPTSPFRTGHDIDRCVQIARKTKADTVVSVTQTRQHPYWCFEMSPSQRLTSFMNVSLQGKNLVWQNLPLVLYPNGAVYVTTRKMIMQNRIYGDKIFGYLMPLHRSVDLEENLDFLVASAVLETYGVEETEVLKYVG